MANNAAPWPWQPTPFRQIAPVSALRIPIGYSDRSTAIAPGTVVRAGTTLCENPSQLFHFGIAPVAGRVGNSHRAKLSSGRDATVVELEIAKQDFQINDETSPDICSREMDSGNADSAEVDSGDAPTVANSDAQSLRPIPIDSALAQVIDLLRQRGVHADRRDCPDLIAQLSDALTHPIDTLICSVIDTSPTARVVSAMAAAHPADVCDGITLLERALAVRKTIVAFDGAAPMSWTGGLRRLLKSTPVRTVNLGNDYPQTDPTLMLYSLTGRRLSPGATPTVQGVVLIDAVVAAAIGQAARGIVLSRVPMAINDHRDHSVMLCEVPVGIGVNDLLLALRIRDENIDLRMGDLLRDRALPNDAIIMAGELTIHITAKKAAASPDPCVRCGWCIDVCPTRLQPAVVLDAAQRDDILMADRAGLAACIECGLCSYVCPSQLPLLQGVRVMRGNHQATV